LLVVLGILAGAGVHGVYAYRDMLRALSARVAELPLAGELNQQVADLRVAMHDARSEEFATEIHDQEIQQKISQALQGVQQAFSAYRAELERHAAQGEPLGGFDQERATIRDLELGLARLVPRASDPAWRREAARFAPLRQELIDLQQLTSNLPSALHHNLQNLRTEVRSQYRTLLGVMAVASGASLLMLGLFVHCFYRWVFRPLRILTKGSRKVAAGCFDHRIDLDSHDEMGELAAALNDMTGRFRTIRDDLDRQVRERTRQVVRGEKLASVGFLAAGVAHEINNPLASIAICAESLETRIGDIFPEEDESIELVRHYLRIIQNEAFRCKDITSKLLDFSRMGPGQRERVELRGLVQEMVDLLAHHGKYKEKRLVLEPGPALTALVNPQEFKQVVLNLLVNGLDHIEPGGTVAVQIQPDGAWAEMIVRDDGCGMTDEVLEHLFEPFFTRRRHGQGTGLGLSISYRIIQDHHGQLEASSPGPGQGSRFRVLLPRDDLNETHKEAAHGRQAA